MRILVFHGSPDIRSIEQVRSEFEPDAELRLDIDAPQIVCKALSMEKVLSRVYDSENGYSEISAQGSVFTTKETREPRAYFFRDGDVGCFEVKGSHVKGDVKRWSDLCDVRLSCPASGLDAVISKGFCKDIPIYDDDGLNMESRGDFVGSMYYDNGLWMRPNRPIIVRFGDIIESYVDGMKTTFIEDRSTIQQIRTQDCPAALIHPGSLMAVGRCSIKGSYDLKDKALSAHYSLLR